jgi:hypothetical protein
MAYESDYESEYVESENWSPSPAVAKARSRTAGALRRATAWF